LKKANVPEAEHREPLTAPDLSGDPLAALRAIVALLRGPRGCPWDREQTHRSLRADVLEEAYEVVAAIDTGDDANLREELGDLLLQVVFHAQIAAEEQRFTFDDLARGIAEKLVRRHPHVFGTDDCADAGAVLQRWDEIKRAEKGASSAKDKNTFDDNTPALPALVRAEKIQKAAARLGFDWNDVGPVIEKVREEVAEVELAISRRDEDGRRPTEIARIEDEIGDLLFAVVNLARKLQIDAEVALAAATRKFVARFTSVQALAHARGREFAKLTLVEMDALWDEVKRTKKAG
jgi:MazG family protein